MPEREIRNEADLLDAASSAAALAADPLDQARIYLLTLASASEARRSGSPLTIETGDQVLEIVGGTAHHVLGRPASNGTLTPVDPVALVHHLTELKKAVRELRAEREALQAELEETNRGVLALYTELDDRAEKLKRADDLKSRFLSYASHELRTPLNGIVGLIRLLNTRSATRDPEEQKQLSFVLRSAEEMREMVNDLLDLAKVEAGKVTIQPSEFGLDFVFGALRGIFRPLLQTDDVVLIFDDTSAVPSIYSDEAKVSQILRNLISNALKFTEHGEVRVWAEQENDLVRISVQDTGIGIAPEHLSKIFEEYAQIEHPLQRRVRGTGLGLPLCRKLSHLLGGRIEVESEIGRGSLFSLILPRHFETITTALDVQLIPKRESRKQPKVLIIDHAEIDRYLLNQLIRGACACDVLQAEDGKKGLEIAQREQPDLIFLDLNMPLIDASVVLTELRSNPRTARISIVAMTARILSDEEREAVERATLAILPKEDIADARRLTIDFGPTVSVKLCDS